MVSFLDVNLEVIIQRFSNSWRKLVENHKFTIPNKVHIIVTHLLDFLKKNKITLHSKSDQTIESVHQEMESRLSAGKYHVKNHKSLIHGKRLLSGMVFKYIYINKHHFLWLI